MYEKVDGCAVNASDLNFYYFEKYHCSVALCVCESVCAHRERETIRHHILLSLILWVFFNSIILLRKSCLKEISLHSSEYYVI